MSSQHPVARLCEALLVSRSGYYAWLERRRHPGPRQAETAHLRERIREEFARSPQTIAVRDWRMLLVVREGVIASLG